MNDLSFSVNPRREAVLREYVEQMVIRTAHCHASFAEPIMKRALEIPNAERLRWGEKVSKREFKFCCVLQDVASQYAAEGFRPSGPLARPPTAQPAPLYLRNSDDMSYIDDVEIEGSGSEGAVAVAVNPADLSSMTREDVERCLCKGQLAMSSIPFDIALEILRPEQPLLDIIVNENAILSTELNNWISLFCRRRVAWRTIHEHLLHLTNPKVFPKVVNSDTNMTQLLQNVCTEVIDLFYQTEGQQADLTISIVEDDSVLDHTPEGERVLQNGEASPLADPEPSDAVHSIEGHLYYVFREAIKNACVASCLNSDNVKVVVRFAVDARWVVVEVVDTAMGIPEASRRDAWKFGWTTSQSYEGLLGGFGVGLPTSKVYMDLWGGSMDLYTRVGQGTTVRIKYPKKPIEVPAPPPRTETAI